MDNLHIFLGATVADAAASLYTGFMIQKIKSIYKGKKEITF